MFSLGLCLFTSFILVGTNRFHFIKTCRRFLLLVHHVIIEREFSMEYRKFEFLRQLEGNVYIGRQMSRGGKVMVRLIVPTGSCLHVVKRDP